ncbi:Flagellar assembly protein FliH/Type III secretion system HrpE domain-containing protein [Hyphomicrobium sp. 1Nfss2.1]|uniref:hypothetical protein n=1 Tax=Hyphomicrobium sp. 1Nfss2.1 TaxID=3413936 RepID=UPI003C798EEF
MSVAPVAHFLVDFGAAPLVAAAREESPLAAATPEADWEERLADAYARGIEEGKRLAEAEAIAHLEAQKAAWEKSTAEAREAWCADTGSGISAQIAAAFGELEDQIATAAERVLMPLVSQSARTQAVQQLRNIIVDLAATNPGIGLQISGPEDLLSIVRDSLPASIADPVYTVTDKTDIQIKAGASLLETRIASWLNASEGQSA